MCLSGTKGFAGKWLALLLASLLFFSFSTRGFTQSYLDVGIGTVAGDFDTGVDTTVNSLTVQYGYFGAQFFASASASYLSLDTEGLDAQSGPGDVLLEAGYIYRAQGGDLKLLPSVSLKLPTASEDDNLGSGETDFGIFLDVFKKCGGFTCTASAGYLFVGDPPDLDYNDIVRMSVGGFVSFEQSGLSGYLQYESAFIDRRTDPVKLGLNWFYLTDLDTSFYIDGIFGLNATAPDYGFHTGIVNWF